MAPQTKRKTGHPKDPLGGEDALIANHFAPLAADWPGAHGLRDDCASILPAPGHEIVLKIDPVRAGVHFFLDDAPEDIAWKALAVNVSDLAAKAARPLAYLLALSFPEKPDPVWLASFARGLAQAQTAFGCVLIGGDTDRADGPLSIAVTVIGEAPAGKMVRRDMAQPGDALYASGHLGEAALGLAVRAGADEVPSWSLSAAERDGLRRRYLRPEPRLGLKTALRNFSRAAMDLSDGLAKDLGRMCRASGCGAEVEIADLPRSKTMDRLLGADPGLVAKLAAAGDDYEILAAVPPENENDFIASARSGRVVVSRIGQMSHGEGVRLRGLDGRELQLEATGYDHFADK
jgi:thiamine-monophosphate kinase